METDTFCLRCGCQLGDGDEECPICDAKESEEQPWMK